MDHHWWLGVAVGLGLMACDPSDFDKFEPSADRDAGSDTGAGDMPRAGRGGKGGAAAHGGGGKAGGDAGRAGAAGVAGRGAAADGGGSGGVGGGGAGGSGGASGTGGTGPAPCTHPSDLSKVKIGTSEIGELAGPSWVGQRTLASATVVKDRILLLFTVPDRSGMAAWGDLQGLTASPPRVTEMAPYTPLFDSTAYPADRKFSLGSGVNDGDTALVYFASTQGFTIDAAGIGRLALGDKSAEVLRAAGALFPPGANPPAWRPAFVNGALVVTEGDVDYVYVYACQADPNNPDEADEGPRSKPCRLARVPRPDAATAESYRYWTGSEWSDDVTRAAIVVDHAGGNVSVSYNAYLQKYLMVHSSLANSVVLRWADRPEGPWNPLGELSTVMASGGFGTTFSAIELTGLRDACQQVTYVSYNSSVSAPTPTDANAADYATRFVRVELK